MGIPDFKDLGALLGMTPLGTGPTGPVGPGGDAGEHWTQTPSWIFWRPAWRMIEWDDPHRTSPYWRYQTNKQRAKEVLREKFDANYVDMEFLVRSGAWTGRMPKL